MHTIINSLPPILLVDDDPVVLEISIAALEGEGITNIAVLNDSRKIMQFLETNPVSLIVLDLMMPHVTGIDLLPPPDT